MKRSGIFSFISVYPNPHKFNKLRNIYLRRHKPIIPMGNLRPFLRRLNPRRWNCIHVAPIRSSLTMLGVSLRNDGRKAPAYRVADSRNECGVYVSSPIGKSRNHYASGVDVAGSARKRLEQAVCLATRVPADVVTLFSMLAHQRVSTSMS